MRKGLLSIALLWTVALARTLAAGQEVAAAPAEIHGDGEWKPAGKTQPTAQRWQLDVHRDEHGSLRGRIAVHGSALFSSGNVEGKVDGDTVRGTVRDDEGAEIASFTGKVSGSAMSGTYTDRTGEVGSWEWDGSVPEALKADQ